jgi:hypothetical protein
VRKCTFVFVSVCIRVFCRYVCVYVRVSVCVCAWFFCICCICAFVGMCLPECGEEDKCELYTSVCVWMLVCLSVFVCVLSFGVH